MIKENNCSSGVDDRKSESVTTIFIEKCHGKNKRLKHFEEIRTKIKMNRTR